MALHLPASSETFRSWVETLPVAFHAYAQQLTGLFTEYAKTSVYFQASQSTKIYFCSGQEERQQLFAKFRQLLPDFQVYSGAPAINSEGPALLLDLFNSAPSDRIRKAFLNNRLASDIVGVKSAEEVTVRVRKISQESSYIRLSEFPQLRPSLLLAAAVGGHQGPLDLPMLLGPAARETKSDSPAFDRYRNQFNHQETTREVIPQKLAGFFATDEFCRAVNILKEWVATLDFRPAPPSTLVSAWGVLNWPVQGLDQDSKWKIHEDLLLHFLTRDNAPSWAATVEHPLWQFILEDPIGWLAWARDRDSKSALEWFHINFPKIQDSSIHFYCSRLRIPQEDRACLQLGRTIFKVTTSREHHRHLLQYLHPGKVVLLTTTLSDNTVLWTISDPLAPIEKLILSGIQEAASKGFATISVVGPFGENEATTLRACAQILVDSTSPGISEIRFHVSQRPRYYLNKSKTRASLDIIDLFALLHRLSDEENEWFLLSGFQLLDSDDEPADLHGALEYFLESGIRHADELRDVAIDMLDDPRLSTSRGKLAEMLRGYSRPCALAALYAWHSGHKCTTTLAHLLQPFSALRTTTVDKYLFLSHDSRDKADLVDLLYAELTKIMDEKVIFYDKCSIEYQESIQVKVAQGVQQSAVVAVIVTGNVLENLTRPNSWMKTEILMACGVVDRSVIYIFDDRPGKLAFSTLVKGLSENVPVFDPATKSPCLSSGFEAVAQILKNVFLQKTLIKPQGPPVLALCAGPVGVKILQPICTELTKAKIRLLPPPYEIDQITRESPFILAYLSEETFDREECVQKIRAGLQLNLQFCFIVENKRQGQSFLSKLWPSSSKSSVSTTHFGEMIYRFEQQFGCKDLESRYPVFRITEPPEKTAAAIVDFLSET